MCGICGFIKSGRPDPIDDVILARMTRAMSHRGPDAEGFWTGEGAFLGHRRLSVIDIAGGGQPMANEDGRVVVVFNGEVYNHAELRRDLAARGHSFTTRCDTEVLVHLWEDEREAGPGRLNGMFAYAIWDGRDRTLFLTRDRMGKKPLYWGVFGGEAVFASEMRPLLLHPAVPRDVDPEALYQYLTLDWVPAPLAMLKGVRKVPAGGWVLIRDGVATEGLYTDIRVPDKPLKLDASDAAALIWEALGRAVTRRLESDVPLGVFLSGGLDSTAVVAEMARFVPGRRISTFTVGFEDPSFDESGPARAVAEHFGTDHHEAVLSGREALDLVGRCAEIADEPLADYSILPTFLLARFARETVTVALSGDGGDELFLGYETFLADSPARLAAGLLPRVALRLLPGIARLLPVSDADMGLDYKAGRFARGLQYPRAERHLAWVGGFDPGDARDCLHQDLSTAIDPSTPYPCAGPILERCAGWPGMKALAYLYCRTYLQDGVLAKVDRASMAHGLEVRSPFLDPEMVRLAFALPAGLSLGISDTKRVLRRMLKGRVPPSIVNRPKKGFGIPLGRWLREDLRPLVEEHLSEKKLSREGFFRPGTVRRLVDEHMSRAVNRRKELFSLLVFEMWLSRYIL